MTARGQCRYKGDVKLEEYNILDKEIGMCKYNTNENKYTTMGEKHEESGTLLTLHAMMESPWSCLCCAGMW